MRCGKCGRDIQVGLSQCPYCQNPIHYGGNTQFYNQAAQNELSITAFFSNIFSTQPAGAGDRMFVSGTALTTPTPDRMLQEWNKPWLYARVLAVGILFCLLCYFMFAKQNHPGGMYFLFCFGSLLFPLSILVFYWEINIPRDIPLYRVLLIFFIGGMLSLIFTLMLPQTDGPAYLAPLTEEPAKVLALAIFIYLLDIRYIFGGLLVGAAVGAGFAAFEHIVYVMHMSIMQTIVALINYLQNNPHVEAKVLIEIVRKMPEVIYNFGIDTLIFRSLGTLGGHVTLAAIEGGALAMVKGKDSFKANHFFDPRFLAYLGAAMAIHWAWNYGFSLYQLPYIEDATYVILILLAVFVVFTLIQRAVTQILDEVNSANVPTPAPSASAPMLLATAGPLVNALFPIENRITFGRDPALCNVVFPAGTVGVSRRHCVMERHLNELFLMDLNSSAGTFLQNGQRLQPNQWVKITNGFYLGSPNVMFSVQQIGNPQPVSPPPPQPAVQNPQPVAANNVVSISGIVGALQGSTFSDSQRLVIGRDPSQCNVVLPERTPGVSRKHCVLERRGNDICIMDVGSSAGTFLPNGQRLPLNQWIPITGDFYLGSTNVGFKVN